MMILRAQISSIAGGLFLAIGFSLSATAGVVSPQQLDWCKNMSDAYSPDLRIIGCTAAIQSGQWSGKDLAWAFTDRCFGYFIKRDYDSAVVDCTETIRLDPDDAYPYQLRGSAYLNKGNYSDAVTDFNKLISLEPGSADPYELRGSAYLGKGDYSNAITDFNKVISLDPNNAAAFYNRGNAKAVSGDTAGAAADIAHAKQLQPTIGQ